MCVNYKTVQTRGEAEFEISRSRFLSFAQRAETEAEALTFIQQIKKLHWEARHHCSAYILGSRGEIQRADDDGEPSGTAGRPILEILKKNDLRNAVIVVTRYFGGIKLGAGGLIRAYGKAASLSINAAAIVEKVAFVRLHVDIDYSRLGALEHNLRLQEHFVEAKEFSDNVRLTILARAGDEEKVSAAIIDWTGSACAIDKGETIYRELPVV